jgi:Uma2 family endonuclease
MTVTKAAGTWTYDDLFSLPDDGKRYEIIEGELYEMPSPSLFHALTITNLFLLLAPIVERLGGQILMAPLDVFFQGADPVQSDILVILPGWEGRLAQRGPQGAPDLVIEVLSPSNRGHDLLTKRALYARAGVREYWIVDPEARTLDILTLERDALHTRRTASGDEDILSPLLEGAEFPVAAVFARFDEIED